MGESAPEQGGANVAQVLLINPFEVPAGQEAAFLDQWHATDRCAPTCNTSDELLKDFTESAKGPTERDGLGARQSLAAAAARR
jgi:hypothetical protein